MLVVITVYICVGWEEAISAEHVKLVLSAEPEPLGCPESQIDISALAALAAYSEEIDFENQQLDAGHFSSTGRNVKAKNRTNSEKGVKIKYIPKQKVAS